LVVAQFTGVSRLAFDFVSGHRLTALLAMLMPCEAVFAKHGIALAALATLVHVVGFHARRLVSQVALASIALHGCHHGVVLFAPQ
jgi:hypothetical protein